MNPFKAVKDFHIKYKQDVDKEITEERINLRWDLIDEECLEVFQEVEPYLFKELKYKGINKQNLTKELADLIYVTIGMAVTFGLPLEEVYTRIHNANMTKNGGFNENGKILKGDGFVPAEVGDLFDKE